MDQPLDDGFSTASAVEENPQQAHSSRAYDSERILEHDSADGSGEDDHGGSGLQHLADVTALEQQSAARVLANPRLISIYSAGRGYSAFEAGKW